MASNEASSDNLSDLVSQLQGDLNVLKRKNKQRANERKTTRRAPKRTNNFIRRNYDGSGQHVRTYNPRKRLRSDYESEGANQGELNQKAQSAL